MRFQEHYSTIVIGAGPAGIMAALHAAPKGDVLLIEAMDLPRNKSCGGMLNEYSQTFLERFGSLDSSLICEPEWIDFRFFDWDRDIRKSSHLHFKNVDRAAFDDWLVSLLPDNVTVAGNTRFISCVQNPHVVTVYVQRANKVDASPQSIYCDYLIACDGPRSSVRRCLPVSQLGLYKTLQDYLPLNIELEPYFDCIYSRNIGTDYGYGYIIPKSEVAIVGSVFFPNSKNCLQLHEKAVDTFRSYYHYSQDHTKREAWIAVSVRSTKDIVGGYKRVLLAGEAGGLMSPSSGEGISFALNSGMRAGIAVAEHADCALEAYRAALKPLRSNIARRLMYFPILNSNWGKWIGGSSPLWLVDKVAHRI